MGGAEQAIGIGVLDEVREQEAGNAALSFHPNAIALPQSLLPTRQLLGQPAVSHDYIEEQLLLSQKGFLNCNTASSPEMSCVAVLESCSW